jgi:hypothetical protein
VLTWVPRTITAPRRCCWCCPESCTHLTRSPDAPSSNRINDIRVRSAQKNRRCSGISRGLSSVAPPILPRCPLFAFWDRWRDWTDLSYVSGPLWSLVRLV